MGVAMSRQDYSSGQPTKIWNQVFISVFIANMVMYLGQQMTQALIAKYADHLGAPASIVGLVVSTSAVTGLIFKLFSGSVIDTFNRKYILMGALLVMAMAFFGYSISRTIPMLILFRLLQGVALAFTATTCLTLAADALPMNKLGAGIGYFSLAQAASQAIGPTVALTLEKTFGYAVAFAISGGIILCAIFAVSRIILQYRSEKKFRISLDSVFAKEATTFTVLMFFLALAYSVINSFLIVYAGKLMVENIGYFFTVYAVTLLFTRPLIGRMSDKIGHVKTLFPAMLCFTSAFIMISCSSSLPLFLISAFVSAFGYGACQPAIQALAMKCVPKERRGAASSMNFIGTGLGNLVGPALAGALAERLGYQMMWRSMSVPIIVGMVFLFVNRKQVTKVSLRGRA